MKKIRAWKIIYAVCCLAYMSWTINVGTNEFDSINVYSPGSWRAMKQVSAEIG